MTPLIPVSEEEAAIMALEAMKAKTPLRITGGETKLSIGQLVETELSLSTKKLKGITLYEPSEMVLSARAGTTLEDVEEALSKHNQMLPFEPLDYAHLLGTEGKPTLGAVAAGNISGPRRILAGAARDSLIGVRFINGKGELIKNGGRVMKNVTGLDLVKLQAGAWGTLGLLTQVTFKLLPRPEKNITLMLEGLEDETAIKALCRAAGTPFEASGLVHLPKGLGHDKARTLIRLEGFSKQASYRFDEMAKVLSTFGRAVKVDGYEQDVIWQDVIGLRLLAEPRDKAIWRLSVRPTSGPNTIDVIKQALDCTYYYDWSGGLIWLSTNEEGDGGEETIRNAVAAADGHATLIRGSRQLRNRISVFQPQEGALQRLSLGIKRSFDPVSIFNPGLMVKEG